MAKILTTHEAAW